MISELLTLFSRIILPQIYDLQTVETYCMSCLLLCCRSELICSVGSQCACYLWWGHLYIFVIRQQLYSNNVMTEHDNPQLPKRSQKKSVPWLSVCVCQMLFVAFTTMCFLFFGLTDPRSSRYVSLSLSDTHTQ